MRPSRIQGSPVRNKLYTREIRLRIPFLKMLEVWVPQTSIILMFLPSYSPSSFFIASSVFILLLPKFIKKRQYFFRHVLFKNFNGATGMNQHIIPILAETSLIFASQMFPRTSTFAVSPLISTILPGTATHMLITSLIQ